MLIANTQVSKTCKPSAIRSQLICNVGGFLGKLLGPLIKPGSSLIGNVLKAIAKIFFVPLWLGAAVSATDTTIQNNFFRSGHPLDLALQTTALIFYNEKLNDMIRMIKSLEVFVLLIEVFTTTF